MPLIIDSSYIILFSKNRENSDFKVKNVDIKKIVFLTTLIYGDVLPLYLGGQ